MFAFLGPNRAGKTTAVKMLCTLARLSGGRASVAGFDVARQPRAVRRRIDLVFQERLTAASNPLDLLAGNVAGPTTHMPGGRPRSRLVALRRDRAYR